MPGASDKEPATLRDIIAFFDKLFVAQGMDVETQRIYIHILRADDPAVLAFALAVMRGNDGVIQEAWRDLSDAQREQCTRCAKFESEHGVPGCEYIMFWSMFEELVSALPAL
jgi:hypothetical protein